MIKWNKITRHKDGSVSGLPRSRDDVLLGFIYPGLALAERLTDGFFIDCANDEITYPFSAVDRWVYTKDLDNE